MNSNLILASFLKFAERDPRVVDQYVPQMIEGATLQSLLPWVCLFAFVFVMIGLFLPDNVKLWEILTFRRTKRRPNRSITNELGSADFATREMLEPWLKKKNDLDTALPITDLHGAEGTILKSGQLVWPVEERNRHILMVAKTGSGKTTKAILPILYNDCLCPIRSSIVLDSKPEMWDKLVGMTRRYNPGKNILLFNPLDTMRSLSWNIIGKLETDTDAKLISNTIISATDNPSAQGDSPFFRNNAYQILYSIMLGLLEDPNETASMPRIHQLVHSGMHALCDWLEAHPSSIRNTRTFVDLARSGSQNADTIMSELAMRLSAWDLKAIRSTTFSEELNLDDLIDKPTLLIVELRESELEMLRPMANVIVVEIMRYLTKRAEGFPGGKLPRPVGFVIDEFASALGKLPEVHIKLNTVRSRNISFVAAIQSIAQIKANYQDNADSVLSGFSTKIFMPALDFQDSEWASKETGTMTVRYNLASKGRNRRLIDHFAHKSLNTQEQVQQRAVLTPDEIGKPADNASTFFLPNLPVFQGHLTPFYEVPDMVNKFETKIEDFTLRESPLEHVESHVTAPGEEKSDEAQLTEEQLRQAINDFKIALEWDNCSQQAREWWNSFENANEDNLGLVHLLAKEIAVRDSTIESFYRTFAAMQGADIENVLAELDQKRYYKLKVQAGWNEASETTRNWWHELEQANASEPGMMIDLVSDVIENDATLEEFLGFYVHEDLKTIPDILERLANTKAKRQEQRRLGQLNKLVNKDTDKHSQTPEIAPGEADSPLAEDFEYMREEEEFEYQAVASDIGSLLEPLEEEAEATATEEVSLTTESGPEEVEQEFATTDIDETLGEDPFVIYDSTWAEEELTANPFGKSVPSPLAESIEKSTSGIDRPIEKREAHHAAAYQAESNGSLKKPSTAKDAATKLHINGFFEMAEGFISDNKLQDYRMLLELAADDPLIDDEALDRLKGLAG